MDLSGLLSLRLRAGQVVRLLLAQTLKRLGRVGTLLTEAGRGVSANKKDSDCQPGPVCQRMAERLEANVGLTASQGVTLANVGH